MGCTKCGDECVHCYIDADIRKETDWQSPLTPWLSSTVGANLFVQDQLDYAIRMQDELDQINANQA